MYTPGNILYFTPFYFPDGNQPKNKYFIILSDNTHSFLIATLPTSKDCIPSTIEKIHGYIDLPEINFNCYFFKANKSITENKWGFPLDTYIYGEQVAEFNKKSFNAIYAVEGFDYELIGRLVDDEFKCLIECIRNSNSTKRKIRRLLGANI